MLLKTWLGVRSLGAKAKRVEYVPEACESAYRVAKAALCLQSISESVAPCVRLEHAGTISEAVEPRVRQFNPF